MRLDASGCILTRSENFGKFQKLGPTKSVVRDLCEVSCGGNIILTSFHLYVFTRLIAHGGVDLAITTTTANPGAGRRTDADGRRTDDGWTMDG